MYVVFIVPFSWIVFWEFQFYDETSHGDRKPFRRIILVMHNVHVHFDASYWSCTISMSISTHHIGHAQYPCPFRLIIGHPQCPCPFRRIILDIHNAYTECNLNRSWPLCHTLCFSYTNDISCRQHFPGVCIHLVIPIYTFTPFIDI